MQGSRCTRMCVHFAGVHMHLHSADMRTGTCTGTGTYIYGPLPWLLFVRFQTNRFQMDFEKMRAREMKQVEKELYLEVQQVLNPPVASLIFALGRRGGPT